MRLISTLASVALAVTPVVALAQAPAPAAKPAYSTGESTIGAMMANPATKEILLKHLPLLAQAGENPQAGAMTIKDIQQYLPDVNDKLLAAMDADLAKVPAPAK